MNTDPLWFVFSYRNETVLHQFCCPAADAEQKPSSPDSSPRWEMVASKTFIFSTLSSITDLPTLDKTHILYRPILLHPALHPMFPALLSISFSSQRLLFVLLCNCLQPPWSPLTHTQNVFSASLQTSTSTDSHSCLYLFLLYVTLTHACFTLLQIICLTLWGSWTHTLQHLKHSKSQNPKNFKVLSHTLREGGGEHFYLCQMVWACQWRTAIDRYF